MEWGGGVSDSGTAPEDTGTRNREQSARRGLPPRTLLILHVSLCSTLDVVLCCLIPIMRRSKVVIVSGSSLVILFSP